MGPWRPICNTREDTERTLNDDDDQLPLAGDDWLARFEVREGRPLRVLHLGNVANNAYSNAKIQRQHGIEADVSSHDYFHIMACPEWEDADFEGDLVDERFPDWWKVDTHGFRRPEWFAQGSVRMCQRYLLARSRNYGRAKLLARLLTAERWLWCRSTALGRLLGYRGGLAGGARVVARVLRAAARLIGALGDLARGKGLRATAQSQLPVRLTALMRLRDVDESEFGRRYAHAFPSRSPLRATDLRAYERQARGWRRVIREYDVVQAYALDAVVPVLCKTAVWAAYEHGTLREIPFEESTRGRLCAFAYRDAPIVFITNSDVVRAARRLGLRDEQLVFLPHAVDSDRLFRFTAQHEHLRPGPDHPITFFSPTRHDWLDGDPSWAKGNDKLIRAFGRLRDRGIEARLLLVEWGRHVDASRMLIDDLELADRVTWMGPVRKRALWIEYLRAHAVIDQFALRAIGGVTFEALALGCRVLTAIDEPETAAFFGSPPALMACSDPDEIVAAMHRVAEDPLDQAGLGAAGRAWFERYHSAERIVELQLAAYQRLLGPAR